MKNKNSILLLFLLTSFSALTQETQTDHQLRLSPVRVLDLMNPGIEISYQRAHSGFFATQLLASWQKDLFHITLYNRYSGYRLGIEEKYFFQKKAAVKNVPNSKKYISAEFIFADLKMTDEAWFGYARPNDSLEFAYNYQDLFGIRKKTYTTNIKIGMEQRSRHLVCDVALGLGIRFKDVRHFDRDVPEDNMELPIEPSAYYMATSEGKSITPSMTFSFKLGYIF